MEKTKLKDYVIKQLEEMKIEEIVYVDTSKISSLANHVIIGTGRSGKHVESSIENLRKELKQIDEYEGQIAGTSENGWILYDMGDIIVHLFTPEVRNIYRLDELFASRKFKAEKKEVENKDNSKKEKKVAVKKKTEDKKEKITKKKVVVKKSEKKVTKVKDKKVSKTTKIKVVKAKKE